MGDTHHLTALKQLMGFAEPVIGRASRDPLALPILRFLSPHHIPRCDQAASGGAAAALPEAEVPARLQPRFGTLRALDERGNVRALADVELEMIKRAIDHYNGQMSEVARRLGIGRSTLYRKLKEYGIDPEAGRLDRLAS